MAFAVALGVLGPLANPAEDQWPVLAHVTSSAEADQVFRGAVRIILVDMVDGLPEFGGFPAFLAWASRAGLPRPPHVRLSRDLAWLAVGPRLLRAPDRAPFSTRIPAGRLKLPGHQDFRSDPFPAVLAITVSHKSPSALFLCTP